MEGGGAGSGEVKVDLVEDGGGVTSAEENVEEKEESERGGEEKVGNLDTDNYQGLVQQLRLEFGKGSSRSVEHRVKQLEGFRRLLVEEEETLLAALKTDLNKPTQESIMAEIDFLKNEIT